MSVMQHVASLLSCNHQPIYAQRMSWGTLAVTVAAVPSRPDYATKMLHTCAQSTRTNPVLVHCRARHIPNCSGTVYSMGKRGCWNGLGARQTWLSINSHNSQVIGLPQCSYVLTVRVCVMVQCDSVCAAKV
jgi:hypothetical protein